ncbi:MAG: hypothetical protein AAFY60_18610, partial [Myxococcota bacterium]
MTTSSDGFNYTAVQVAGFNARDFHGVTFHDGLFVLAGEAGVVLTSPDGVTWTERDSDTTERLESVRYLNDAFYAVGGASTITRSFDGISWSAVTGPGNTTLREIATDGTQFVAAGFNVSLRSADGVTWETIMSGPSFRFCVAFGAGRWVQSGNNGTISDSVDSVNWSTANNSVAASYRGCRFANNRMAFVTTAGGVYFEALLRSDTNGPLVVTEGGGADTYTLNLEAAPLADVTVSLSTDGQTELDTDEVVFTPSDWFNPRTVSVTAVDDAVAEGSHSGSISHTVTSPDSRFDGLPIGDVVADITDNDSTSVILSFEGAQNQVGEDGVTDSYTIALSTLPTDPVRVVLVANAQVTVDPSEVSFNAGNFDQPVTITVSAVDDSVDDDGVVGNIV